MAYSRGIQIEDETTKRIIETATAIAQQDGMEKLSVKRILEEMNVSNRVFYNRFRNIEDVIEVMYHEFVGNLRGRIELEKLAEDDHYYETLLELAVSVVRKMYHDDIHFRMRLLSYETSKASNRSWWLEQIEAILKDGVKRGLLKPMNEQAVSYGIWCFCLGYHKEALGQQVSEEEAIAGFIESFSFLIEGMKP